MPAPFETTCTGCGQPFIMGQTGFILICDSCAGVTRDPAGRFWVKDQTVMSEVGQDGVIRIIRREDAFKV